MQAEDVFGMQPFFEGGIGRNMFGAFGEFLSARSLVLFASGCRRFQALVMSKEWDHVWIDVTERSCYPFVCVKVGRNINMTVWKHVNPSNIKYLDFERWNRSYEHLLLQMTRLEHLECGRSNNGRIFSTPQMRVCIKPSWTSELTSLTSLKANVTAYNLKYLTTLKKLHYTGILSVGNDKLDIIELDNEHKSFTKRSAINGRTPVKLPKLKVLSCYTDMLQTYSDMTSLEVLRLKTFGEEVDCNQIWLKYSTLKNLDVEDSGRRW